MHARIGDVRSWLEDQALPFWAHWGIDGKCGFVEHLRFGPEAAEVRYKRLRVQARQIYVFSRAYLMGYSEGIDLARNGWCFIREHGWSASGGWVRLLGRRGDVIDSTLDLYDQAFALLAVAWWVRASGDQNAVSWADRTLEAIDEWLTPPCGVGWLSEHGAAGTLLQNPHMHLLEALLALYETTGETRFKAAVEKVLGVFESVLFDPSSRTLAEYYDEGWKRASGERGRIVEPGHHYEWVWLLNHAETVIPGSSHRAHALFSFAERFGQDPATGLIYDEVADDGSVRAASYRSWPNSEALRAHLAQFELWGSLDITRITQILDNLFRYFLATPTPGTWIDRFDRYRRPKSDTIPASTLYHLMAAFSELLRLEPQLRALGR